MNELEIIQDKIDEYIRGTMSDTDRMAFEDELRHNTELRREVEVQISISDAVQAVYLKQMLKEIEAASEQKYRITSKRIYLWVSIAAAIAILIFVGNMWWQAHRIKAFGNEYYAHLEFPVPRDGNQLDSLLATAYSFIGTEQYVEAENSLAEAGRLIEEGLRITVVDDETSYQRQVYELKKYDVQWYKALILMKQGKYRDAKALLIEISQSESMYAEQSKEILDKMFNVKL